MLKLLQYLAYGKLVAICWYDKNFDENAQLNTPTKKQSNKLAYTSHLHQLLKNLDFNQETLWKFRVVIFYTFCVRTLYTYYIYI